MFTKSLALFLVFFIVVSTVRPVHDDYAHTQEKVEIEESFKSKKESLSFQDLSALEELSFSFEERGLFYIHNHLADTVSLIPHLLESLHLSLPPPSIV